MALSKPFYTFTPQGQTFNNVTNDQVANFTGDLSNLSIVGRVTDVNGVGLSGVTLNLTGSQTRSVVTNQNGTYMFDGVTAGGDYLVTPAFSSGTFSPGSRSFNALSTTGVADFRSSLSRTVQLESTAFSVDEGTEAAVIAVIRAGDLSGQSTIEYETSDGTANQGRDYTTSNGTLTFAPGENRKTFSVLITDNGYVDGPRTVIITLKNPTVATVDTPFEGI